MTVERTPEMASMEQTLVTALLGNDVAVPAGDPAPPPAEPEPEPEKKPEPEPEPVKTPAPNAEVEATLAKLNAQMEQLVGEFAASREKSGQEQPANANALAELAADPSATPEAKLVAEQIIALQKSIESVQGVIEAQEQARFDQQYDAEKASFAAKYPTFTKAEIDAIDKAFGAATEKTPGIEALTFEEFAARHLGGYDGLLARRAPTRGDKPHVVPGGKPPAKIVAESATGGGRASLGKPLDRHATQDDVAARLTASLLATR